MGERSSERLLKLGWGTCRTLKKTISTGCTKYVPEMERKPDVHLLRPPHLFSPVLRLNSSLPQSWSWRHAQRTIIRKQHIWDSSFNDPELSEYRGAGVPLETESTANIHHWRKQPHECLLRTRPTKWLVLQVYYCVLFLTTIHKNKEGDHL